jgi:hypothetical protein
VGLRFRAHMGTDTALRQADSAVFLKPGIPMVRHHITRMNTSGEEVTEYFYTNESLFSSGSGLLSAKSDEEARKMPPEANSESHLSITTGSTTVECPPGAVLRLRARNPSWYAHDGSEPESEKGAGTRVGSSREQRAASTFDASLSEYLLDQGAIDLDQKPHEDYEGYLVCPKDQAVTDSRGDCEFERLEPIIIPNLTGRLFFYNESGKPISVLTQEAMMVGQEMMPLVYSGSVPTGFSIRVDTTIRSAQLLPRTTMETD